MMAREHSASLILRSAWAKMRKMWTILALALSARSSSSVATWRSAFDSGSRRPSCAKILQNSFRGVGPFDHRGISTAGVFKETYETYM